MAHRFPSTAVSLLSSAVAVAALAIALIGGTATRVVERTPQAATEPAALKSGTLTASQLYSRAAPGVVEIDAAGTVDVGGPFGGQERQTWTGSGFEVDKNGLIVTNDHVVDGASQLTVKLAGGARRTAKVVATDAKNDVAVIKVDPAGLNLHPLALGNSPGVSVGDAVAAIGNPFGLDRSLSTGIVSAVGRNVEGSGGASIKNAIQTDAALNPGNSGGPLLDARDRVIGITSEIVSTSSSGGQANNTGVGFAVPIDTVKQLLQTAGYRQTSA